MIAPARAYGSPMLLQAVPRLGAGTGLQGMGAYSHDSRTCPAVGAGFTWLPEEVDAARRPGHSAGTVVQSAHPSQSAFKHARQAIEPAEVFQARRCHQAKSTGFTVSELSLTVSECTGEEVRG